MNDDYECDDYEYYVQLYPCWVTVDGYGNSPLCDGWCAGGDWDNSVVNVP